MKIYDKGTAIDIAADISDRSRVLTDPDTTVISVFDPSGAVKISDLAMNKITTGKYLFTWQSLDTDAIGQYIVRIKAIKGSYTSIQKMKLFTLE